MKRQRTAVSTKKKVHLRKYLVNYLGLLPFFALFSVFVLYPFFYGIVMSFTDWSVSSRAKSISWGSPTTSSCSPAWGPPPCGSWRR